MTRSINSGKLTIQLTAVVQNASTVNTSRVATGPVSFVSNHTITDGVDGGMANRAWEWQETLASGENLTLDLSTFTGFDFGMGDGRDIVGQTMSPVVEIVAIAIKNDNAIGVAGYLAIHPDASNGWTPIGTHSIANGGALLAQGVLLKTQLENGGYTVSGSSKNITFEAQGGSVDLVIALFGRHDDDESSNSSSSSVSSSSSSSLSSSSSFSSSSSSSSSSQSSSSVSSSSSSSINSSSSSSSPSSVSSASSLNSSSSSSSSLNSSSSSSSNSSSSNSSSSSLSSSSVSSSSSSSQSSSSSS